MDKIKLDRVLFEFMEKTTKKNRYNYELFIQNLADNVEYFYDLYREDSDWEELAPYFDKYKREETLEKLLKAFIFGYEQEVEIEVDKNTNAVVVEYAIWGEEGRYDVSIKKEYSEDESFKKPLTFEEVLNKFPKLWPFAQNNK